MINFATKWMKFRIVWRIINRIKMILALKKRIHSMDVLDNILERKKEVPLKTKKISRSRNQGLLGCEHLHKKNKKHQSQAAAAKKTTKVVCKTTFRSIVIYQLNWFSRGR